MTRKELYDNIKGDLDEAGIEHTKEVKRAVDAAVCCTLESVLEYAQSVSVEMITKGLPSEAMTVGVIISKIKAYMNGC
jgi:hypothetical protein